MMMFQRVNGFICCGKFEHGNNPWHLTNSTGFNIVGYWSKLKTVILAALQIHYW